MVFELFENGSWRIRNKMTDANPLAVGSTVEQFVAINNLMKFKPTIVMFASEAIPLWRNVVELVLPIPEDMYQ